jgi:hypothetical protein
MPGHQSRKITVPNGKTAAQRHYDRDNNENKILTLGISGIHKRQ